MLDREHRLLIGNKAHYSAILHLEMLSQEIWKRKLRFEDFLSPDQGRFLRTQPTFLK